MRKTRRTKRRNAESYVNKVTATAKQPATEFYTREKLTAKQRNNFRVLLYDDFHKLL
jgi:hypothetical protein